MNLAQALKYKNRVVTEINRLKAIVGSGNVKNNGDNRPFDIAATHSRFVGLTEHLIDLKVLIDEANVPIRKDIESLREYKGLLVWYACLNTNADAQIYADFQVSRNAVLSTSDVDVITTKLQKDINDIQDKIDVYNATTQLPKFTLLV